MKSKLLKSKLRVCALVLVALSCFSAEADTIPSAFKEPLTWRVGLEVNPAFVPGTNYFLKGENSLGKRISSMTAVGGRADFSFSPKTREGMLYRGLYQGLGVQVNSFFADNLLGTPVSAYVYQGAPIVRFSSRLWLGYEWKFGAAFGWRHYEREFNEDNSAVSTSVTAHMGVALKLHYAITDNWQLVAGAEATHFSNGNTSWPNAGVNALGATIGLAYVINGRQADPVVSDAIEDEADKGQWIYDVIAYGAWRRRAVPIDGEMHLIPGKFGVAGVQFSPMRTLNRWVAVGPSLDLQWDESSGLAPYWIEGSYGDSMKFRRPPFGKQLAVGVSAHAELTMPIFTVNVGFGYNLLNPEGDKRFYQSLALKTFVTKNVFLNVGYRLGEFKDPQNLMLGVGYRFR